MSLTSVQNLFLSAVKSGLIGGCVSWRELPMEAWQNIFRLAAIHKVTPLVYEATVGCPAAKKPDSFPFIQSKKTVVFRQVYEQSMGTVDFVPLYNRLSHAGVKPLAVKGIICRDLYAKPDHRISLEEDVLILPEQFQMCHQILTGYGMVLAPKNKNLDLSTAKEAVYMRPQRQLNVALHADLFPVDCGVRVNLNTYFTGVFDRAVKTKAGNTEVWTLEYTDHMFYLICDAFRRFYEGTLSIRNVSDIALYANAYGSKIKWYWMLQNCKRIKADQFAAALFEIGRKHLVFDPDEAHFPECWTEIKVKEQPLLEDIMGIGDYTEENADAKKRGRIVKAGTARTGNLMKRFLDLRKQPENEEQVLEAEKAALRKKREPILRQYGVIK